jgi:hypothetical protein
MEAAIRRAVANVFTFGDTDVFPFPDENRLLQPNEDDVVRVCLEMHGDLETALSTYPPTFYDSFVPNGYTGFRWATQIDTYWNIYFLALVISLSDEIEKQRIPRSLNKVHSYRFKSGSDAELWDRTFGWRSFYDKNRSLSEDAKYVVTCDVSEFYRRIYHHRVENALKQLTKSDIPSRIMRILFVFSRQTSYGLPIGGPAARLLSELVLNQIDHLLNNAGYNFCRFADDYVIFCEDRTSAYDALLFISEKLQINQGLALQRSKTRILTSSEYRNSQPLILDDGEEESELVAREKQKLFNINLYYDPYSTTAATDYDNLKLDISHLDILYLLNHEIRKSRIHQPTITRIVKALSHARQDIADEAIMTIASNLESFYPCLSTVMIMFNQLFDQLSQRTRDSLVEIIGKHIEDGDYILKTESFKGYAIRLLSRSNTPAVDAMLSSAFDNDGPIVRREVICALDRRQNWMMISDLKHKFSNMSAGERRAMIVASYVLGDEGRHWRGAVSRTFDPFEKLVFKWSGGNTKPK